MKMENMVNKVDTTMEEVKEEVKKEAVSILKEELEKKHGKFIPAEPILNYLIAKCENDNTFCQNVEKENKSFDECIKYLTQEITKLLNKENGCLPGQQVFDMAENYYISDDIVIEVPKQVVHTTPRPKTHTNVGVAVVPSKAKEPEEEQISLFMF